MTTVATNPNRARLSSEIAQLNMKPLWERVMRLKPGTAAQPVIWRWQQVQPYLMRAAELGPAYVRAWDEWAAEGEAAAWDTVVGAGIEPGR